VVPLGTQHLLPDRRQQWRMSLHMSLVPQPTQSRLHVRLHPKRMRSTLVGSSANGSMNSYQTQYARSFWTTSGSETTSAGQYSTADRRDSLSVPANMCFDPTPRHADARVASILYIDIKNTLAERVPVACFR
jgi:hypothetical protein